MHPILTLRRLLFLYLLAWAPITAVLALGTRSAGASWAETLEALAPACLLYAFVCLSPWYICRAFPLRLSSMSSAVLTLVVASAAASLLLGESARLAAMAIEKPPPEW